MGKSTDLSRRQFLAGLGTAGLSMAAIAGGTTAASASEAGEGAIPAGTRYTKWANPDGISYVHESSKSEDWDVVVLGSGITGMTAALVIAEQAPDARILIAEAQNIPGGNTNWAEICANGPEPTYEEAREKAIQKVQDSGELRDLYLWTSFYYDMGKDSAWYYNKHGVKQDETHFYYENWTGAGAIATLVDQMNTMDEYKNVELRLNCRGIALLTEDEYTVTGVQVFQDGEYVNLNAKAVFIATGGMTNNLELNEYYCNEDLQGKCIGYGLGQFGDGHLMVEATAHGKSKSAYPSGGHQLIKDIAFDSPLRYALTEMSWNVFVNQYGERYDDEARTKATIPGYAIMTQGKCWSIFSEPLIKAFEENGSHRQNSFYYNTPTSLQEDLEKYKDNAWMVTADTYEELAEKMGVDVEKFVQTMETYDADAKAGTGDSQFGKAAEWMIPLGDGPYTAYQIFAGLCQSNGGIRVNVQCQVCDRYFVPIKGLYAGGLAISGFNTMVYTGGTAQGVGLWSGLAGGRDIVETVLGGTVDEHWYGEKPYDGPFRDMSTTDGVKPHPEVFKVITYSW